jgi:hypothetical protein
MKKILIVWSTAVLIASAVACSQQTPAAPSADAAAATLAAGASTARSVTDDLSGVTLTTPTLSTPNAGQSFKFTDQPLTLVVKNAISTGTAPMTYGFQVATDAAFASLAFSQEGIAQGGNGSTSVTLPKLPGPLAKNYFWRARASSGGTVGLFTAARTFTIGPEVILAAPVLASPGSGAAVSGTPTLTTNNVQRSGPVTAITYRFDLADSSSFSHIVFTATVPEQGGPSTTVTANNPLGAGTYFWRVQAFDNASTVSSPLSTVSAFTYTPFSMSQATIVSSPFDLANWGETAKITSVTFYPDYFAVDFDKREGADRWPDVPFGDDGNLQYTLGLCLNINGHWYCSAAIQFWHGRDLSASGPPGDIAREWYYDAGRWGPMTGYQPQDGETVGIFVCAGNCRNNNAGDRSYVKERSNVAFVEWANNCGASYVFSNGLRVLRSQRR